ncbi:Alpha/Beta hydrolase protein [Mycena albidolilacea]|uniref:Alpha/Beta hydrolase protein n=1 Tax=Mycena albidolilacea TaxID=1033008 RepID=A0AAD7AM35_9AGAR|nr:Alpha/Beta hydrolase protein [Mycena albidolilacea]
MVQYSRSFLPLSTLSRCVSGWIQPWIYFLLDGETRPILKQHILAEFAKAMWGLGMSSYAILDDDHFLCVIDRKGFALLIVVRISSRTFEELPSPFVDIKYVKCVRSNQVVSVGSKMDRGESIIKTTLHHGSPTFEVLASSSNTPVPDGFAPRPEPLVLHPRAFLPAHSSGIRWSSKREAPLRDALSFRSNIPNVTAVFVGAYSLHIPWMGMADADTRERLDGKAAQLDVQECVEATRQTADNGLIDLDRVPKSMHTPGGLSVLISLIKFPDFYATGCSQSSVWDVAKLYHKSPKLQRFYPALLLGGSPEDLEVPEVYRARSPLFHAEKIKTPVLLAHGSQDVVIPVSQTDAIVAKIKKNGGQVEYLRFENEGHGFRRAARIRAVQERQLAFLERVFGFRMAE